MRGYHRFLAFLLVCAGVLSIWACGAPPDKELNQARGALDAARAAGAVQYAPDEYQAAEAALKRAEEAVTQRDYRLALNFALDSRERAQDAAKVAAEGQALARSQADGAVTQIETIVAQARARLDELDNARPRRVSVSDGRRAIVVANVAVQKAREALSRSDYVAAREATKGVADRLQAAMKEIEAAAAAPVPRRRR
jgi:hypothetical protein